MAKSFRNQQDHITEKDYETFKCSRCRIHYYRMAIDKVIKTCPKCMNPQDVEKETNK